MSIHLHRFVDRVRGAEARGVRDFTMSMDEARDLQADIARLLIDLNTLRANSVKSDQDQVITVKVDGGGF